MTSIGSLSSNGYYQLSNPSGGATPTPATTPSLASALTETTAPTTGTNAYLLDLSPEAQRYMSSGITPPARPGNTHASFALSASQQQELTAILTQYKDAPYTQDTFNKIQNDLNAAGLGPDQLARMDQAKNFNPTQLLIDALSGIRTAETPGSGGEQTKSGNYMQQVIAQWKNISTAAATDGIAPVGSAGGA